MGNACGSTPLATTVAPNDRPAAVKQVPKRYTSRKNVASADGATQLPPKHSQRHLTEEEAASERCVAALRDGETTVLGTRDPATPSLMKEGEDESHRVAFVTDGLSAERANEPSAGQASSASSGPKARGSISSWTVSQNQHSSGGNGDSASLERTASWETFAPLSLSALGSTHHGLQLASATASHNSSRTTDGTTSPQTAANAFENSGTASSYPDTLCCNSSIRPSATITHC